jgi:hypothetical protein
MKMRTERPFAMTAPSPGPRAPWLATATAGTPRAASANTRAGATASPSLPAQPVARTPVAATPKVTAARGDDDLMSLPQ